jgi:hypothetical protein
VPICVNDVARHDFFGESLAALFEDLEAVAAQRWLPPAQTHIVDYAHLCLE